MHLNLMGVQESRASEGMSVKQGVLRLCSGHSQGRWGVELWVNLLQPFAYIKKTALFFRKQDFHVAFRDPRRLLVHISNAHFQSWCFVAHAPQSGISMTERQTWWDARRDLLLRILLADEPLFSALMQMLRPAHQMGFRFSRLVSVTPVGPSFYVTSWMHLSFVSPLPVTATRAQQ